MEIISAVVPVILMFVIFFLFLAICCKDGDDDDETCRDTEFDCDAIQDCYQLKDVCNGNFDARQYVDYCYSHEENVKATCLDIKKDPRCQYGYRVKNWPIILDFPLKECLFTPNYARVNYIIVSNDKCPVEYFLTQTCDEDPQYMNFDYDPIFTSTSKRELTLGDLLVDVNLTMMCIIRKSRCEIRNNFQMVMYQITDRESYKDHLTMLKYWENV